MKINYFWAKCFLIILSSIYLVSCDELNKLINPSSEYLIEKKILPSSEEQILESGSDFRIIIPANAISEDCGMKVKKENSAPDIGNSKLKSGKNFYRIKFDNNVQLNKTITVIYNYDNSSIPNGQTASSVIKGYIYSGGNWKLADYTIDEPNGKIIFRISSISGKSQKDKDEFLDNDDMILGDYTTLDQGQNDADKFEINEEYTPILYYESGMPEPYKVNVFLNGFIKSKGIKLDSRLQDDYSKDIRYLLDAPDKTFELELDVSIGKIANKFEYKSNDGWEQINWEFNLIDSIRLETYLLPENGIGWDAVPNKFEKQVKNGNHLSISGELPSIHNNDIKTVSVIRIGIGFLANKRTKEGNQIKNEDISNNFNYFHLYIKRLK